MEWTDMSLESVKGFGRKVRDLRGLLAFQYSVVLEYSRGSPGALVLSGPAAGLRTSEDEFLNSGAEPEGEVSPDALAMPA
jgi:hypothetical protein